MSERNTSPAPGPRPPAAILLSPTVSSLAFPLLIAGPLLFLQFGCTTQKPKSAPPQESRGESPVFSQSAPPLFVDRVSHFIFDLPVQNPSHRHVRFVRLQPSCTCAGATTLERMELTPGESTRLHFNVEVRNRTGPQQFTCSLIEGDGTEWGCRVQTAFYERARLADGHPLHFGMLEPGTEHAREADLCLYAPKDEPFPSEVAVTTDSDALRIKAGASSDAEQADGVKVRTIPLSLLLKTPHALGPGYASLSASFKHEGLKQTIQAPVDWSVRSRYSASPGSVYFGRVLPGAAPVTRRVNLVAADHHPLRVTALKVSCTGVRASLGAGRKEATPQLELSFDPTGATGPVLGEVAVMIDDPIQPLLKIPIAALVGQSK